MARVDIRNMSTEALFALRDDVDKALAGKRAELERQLERLGGSAGNGRRSLKGRKVAAKYRDSEGNTWAGRRAQEGQEAREFPDQVSPVAASRLATASAGSAPMNLAEESCRLRVLADGP